jgi:MFS family permease
MPLPDGVAVEPGPSRRDVALLFATRSVRLFAYGFLSVVLVLYLSESGLSEARIGALLTATLLGDTLLSLWLTTRADRAGRRRTLAVGAALMTVAAVVFATTDAYGLLLVAATVGVISPAGGEVGPFLAIEQAALAHALPEHRRTSVFAWYGLAGSAATATGSLVAGALVGALGRAGLSPLAGYRAVVLAYGALGLVLLVLFPRLSGAVEAGEGAPAARPALFDPSLGLARSRPIVLRLSALFALDAFGGGFVVQSFVAYWFERRFGLSPELLGALFFGANLLAGISSLAAGALAARFGLLQTMVFTHLPSNVLLLLVPLMPTLPLAVAVLLARFSISQMDVPTRQSYVMAVVAPSERAAAAGVTGIARTIGAALAPLVAGPLYASAALSAAPFLLAGSLKIVYDLLLYRGFRRTRTPGERARGELPGAASRR